MKRWYLLFFSFALTLSCEHEPELNPDYAEVIAFSPDKCMCCWGWTIRAGDKIFMSDDFRLSEIAGFNIAEPVPIFVEIGARDQQCSEFYRLDSISGL